jgi:hypothetical protein
MKTVKRRKSEEYFQDITVKSFIVRFAIPHESPHERAVSKNREFSGHYKLQKLFTERFSITAKTATKMSFCDIMVNIYQTVCYNPQKS